MEADLERGSLNLTHPVDCLISISALRFLPRLIPAAAKSGVRRIIAFGTTSRYSKAASHDVAEREFVGGIANAETEIARLCAQHGIEWTLFRPTLIYGCGLDRNVSLIARLIQRFHCFPLFGGARGKRQPVHADDLAQACIDALDNPATYGKAYNLSGGEVLTYREMVERIFDVLGKPRLFVPVPLIFFRFAMWAIARIPRYRDFSPEMARRMNEDLVFDHSEAARDFGYAPRPFRPDRQTLLSSMAID